jgi:hypothetical protein
MPAELTTVDHPIGRNYPMNRATMLLPAVAVLFI